jgi:hypothetical protein
LTRRTISRAVMAWSFFEVNAVYFTSATSASETRQRSWSSQIARGYLMGVQAVPGMSAIAALTAEFIGAVTEKQAPARRTALVNAAE